MPTYLFENAHGSLLLPYVERDSPDKEVLKQC